MIRKPEFHYGDADGLELDEAVQFDPGGIPGVESAKSLFFGVEVGRGWHSAQYSKMPS